MRLLLTSSSLLTFVRFALPTAALASSFPTAHFMSKSSLISASDALPGRSTPISPGATHFVLKNPLTAAPQGTQAEAIFACGCFWGAEKGFWRLPGVFSTAVGYAGGHTPNPTYEEVCSGRTAHTEVVRVVWDQKLVSFSDLLKLFWECHNPTQVRQSGVLCCCCPCPLPNAITIIGSKALAQLDIITTSHTCCRVWRRATTKALSTAAPYM